MTTDAEQETPHVQIMPSRSVRAKTLAWGLVVVNAWDGAGYAFGADRVAASDSFALLRMIPFGGMRVVGVALLAGALAIAFGIGQDGPQHPHMLNRFLSVGVAVYVGWTLLTPITWWYVHAIPAWGAPTKTAVLALVSYLCARAFARPRERRRRTPPATPASHPEARRHRHRPHSGTEPGHARG